MPPTVRRTRCLSVLYSLMSQTNLEKVVFFTFGDGLFGDKTIVLVPSNVLEGRWYLPPPCDRQKKFLAVEISKVTFSGPERRVWKEDLAPVFMSITAAEVATMGQGCWWQVCLLGYQCGVGVADLRSGGGLTLGRDEGILSIIVGRCGGGVGGVWTAH